jgi:crossover junction endodeoxyribonuclease RusA
MKIISVDVVGVPVAQGSLKRTAFGVIYSNDKELKSWRQDVMTYLIAAKPKDWDIDCAFSVSCEFRFMRPKSHYGTKGTLRPAAPRYKTTKSDTDKLIRSIGDSIQQSGLVRDDSQIIHWAASKRYCEPGESPGASITLSSQP